MILLLAACSRPDEPAPVPDEGPTCADGEVADGEACVPAACGAGTFGDLDDDRVLVAAGAGGGDGSREAPYATIGEALATGALRIGVAAGTYPEVLALGREHGGLDLAGRCAALVTLDGADADEDSAVVLVDGGTETVVTLSGLTLANGRYGGLYAAGGEVVAADLVVTDADSGAISADGRGTKVRLERVTVTGAWSSRYSTSAALLAGSGGSIEATDVVVEGGQGGAVRVETNSDATLAGVTITGVGAADRGYVASALLAIDGDLTVTDAVIADVTDVAAYAYGSGVVTLVDVEIDGVTGEEIGTGLYATEGGTVVATGTRVTAAAGYGVFAESGAATLTDVTIEGLAPFPDGGTPMGVVANGGATVVASGLAIGGYEGSGVIVLDAGTTVSLTDSSVRGLSSSAQEIAGGIGVGNGAAVSLDGVEVADIAGLGVVAADPDSLVTGRLVVRDLTAADAADGSAAGIVAVGGAAIALEDVEVTGIEGVGVAADGSTIDLAGGSVGDVSAIFDPSLGFWVGGGVVGSNGAAVTLTDVAVTGVQGVGVQIGGEGSVGTLARVTVSGTATTLDGLYVRDLDVLSGAAAALTDVTVGDGEGAGMMVHEATVTLAGLAVTSPGGRGVQAQSGALVTGEGLAVTGARDLGLVADGATFELAGVTVSGTLAGDEARTAAGLVVQRDGLATVAGLVAEDNEGPGVVLAGGSLELAGATVAGSRFAGVVALDGALALDGGSVTGTLADGGTGGGFGVFADGLEGDVEVALTDVEVSGHAIGGVWLVDVAGARVVGGRVAGALPVELYPGLAAEGHALYAAGVGLEALLVEGVLLDDAGGAGLFLDGASATLVDVAFEDNVTDVLVQGCSEPEAATPAGLGDDASREVCPTYDRIVGEYTFDFDAPALVVRE
ncbi:MAG: beta strand repeat-containing protein [Myxococcota bacterium]